jgi:hypothetical protein
MKEFPGKVPIIVITQTQHFHSCERALPAGNLLQLLQNKGQGYSMPTPLLPFSLSYPVLNYLTTIK